jgi:hypothetical protein
MYDANVSLPGGGGHCAFVCNKCRGPPKPGDKLRYCSDCKQSAYCSAECQSADWQRHKPECKGMAEARNEVLASGGMDSKQGGRDQANWYSTYPGLLPRVMLVAWKHHSESPLIHLTTSPGKVEDGKRPKVSVKIVPRRRWETYADRDPLLYRTIRDSFDGAGFHQDTNFVMNFDFKHAGAESWPSHLGVHDLSTGMEMDDAEFVRLKGLENINSAQFNGWEGMLMGRDPAHPELYRVQMDSHNGILVYAGNFDRILLCYNAGFRGTDEYVGGYPSLGGSSVRTPQ